MIPSKIKTFLSTLSIFCAWATFSSLEAKCSYSSSSKPTIIARGPSDYDRRAMRQQDSIIYGPPRTRRPVQQEATESCNQPTTISAIYECGELIQLNDDSLWQFTGPDQEVTRTWVQNDPIEVSQTNDACYPFQLTNTCSHTSAKAKMKAGSSKI